MLMNKDDIYKRHGDYLRDIQVVCAQNDIPTYFDLAVRNTGNLNEQHRMVILSPDHDRQIYLVARFDEVGSWHVPEFSFALSREGTCGVAPIMHKGQRMVMTSQRGEDVFPALFNDFMAGFAGKESLEKPLCSLEYRLRNEKIATREIKNRATRLVIS